MTAGGAMRAQRPLGVTHPCACSTGATCGKERSALWTERSTSKRYCAASAKRAAAASDALALDSASMLQMQSGRALEADTTTDRKSEKTS